MLKTESDPHATLERAVAEAEAEVASIQTLVDAAGALASEKQAELDRIESQLDSGAMESDLGALIKTRAAAAGERDAAFQALAGRQARLKSAQEVRDGAVRALAQARLTAGIKELRADDAALLDELLVGVRAAAAKSVLLARRDAELRDLLAPAGYMGMNSPKVPELLMPCGLLAELGQAVTEAFAQERARLLAHRDIAATGVAAREA